MESLCFLIFIKVTVVDAKEIIYYFYTGNQAEENNKTDFDNSEGNARSRDNQSTTLTGSVPIPNTEKSWMARGWSSIDNMLLKPMLTHSSPSLIETMPNCNGCITRTLTSKEQLESFER